MIGAVLITSGISAARGRKLALWTGMIIGLVGAALGTYTLATALSHITKYMDFPGTIGLAVVSALFGVMSWSLWSSRNWAAGKRGPGFDALSHEPTVSRD